MSFNEVHRTELIRSLISAALLTGLIVGVPILLMVAVGWPFPHGVPWSSEAIQAMKTGAIPSLLILKLISVVVWIMWLQMLTAVGVELWAHFQEAVAPRVAFIPSFMQRWAARLMATALAVAFSFQHSGIAASDNQDLLAPTTFEMDTPSEWTAATTNVDVETALSTRSTPSSAHRQVNNENGATLVHTVEQRDSLRVLAERYLGDPNRWTEVFVLNQGQPQAAGGSLTDPALLEPGWELVMPADARLLTPLTLDIEVTQPDSYQPASHFTESRDLQLALLEEDTLWEAADQAPLEPLFQLEPVDQATPVLAYATPPISVVANIPTTSTGIEMSSTDAQPAPDRQTMFAIGGLGVFATGLGWILARVRRTQRRRLPNGRMPLLASDEAIQLEQQLQASADPDAALFLDTSLRMLSAQLAGSSPPQIIGVRLASESFSIHLDAPAEPPPGVHGSDGNMTWKLLRTSVPKHLQIEADRTPAPLPTLAGIGRVGGDEYLLNLEHMVTLSLKGDQEPIDDLCAAMAAQLASSHLADDLTVICVGFGQDLCVFERVEYVADVPSAIERIRQLERQNKALLGSHALPADSRMGSGGEHWQPTVALIPRRLSKEEASSLLDVHGSSVCIVGHGLEGAAWVAEYDDNGLLLQPVNLRLEPHALSGDAVAAVAELVGAAKDTHGVTLTMPRSAEYSRRLPPANPKTTDIEVRVIGTVEVVGTTQPFTSRRAMDLVAYLAFHPSGADRDQLRAHVWPPNEPPSDSAMANTVSRARKALGVDDDGNSYLPRVNSNGVYRLQPAVETDLDRFESLVAAARRDHSERGRGMLQEALSMVRGAPFSGGGGDMYRWADFGLRTQVECLIDTTAHELAERCLEVGDTDGARAATIISLRSLGLCEECFRLRLLAAAENPTEVRRVMAELVAQLKLESDKPESDDLISTNILELYEKLMSGRVVFK